LIFLWWYLLVLKTERDRLAVKEQIDFENKEHQLIQSIRDEEKEKVLKELSTWKTKTDIHDESKKIMFIINNNYEYYITKGLNFCCC